MPFDYRLERIMKIAENEQKNLEVQYQDLYEHLESVAHTLIDLLNKKKLFQKKLERRMKRPTSIESMKLQLSEIDQADQRIARQTLLYQQLTTNLEKFRTVLQEKSIEVKKYEKMKSRQKAIYQHDQMKREAKQMDEVAMLRTASNRV
jgi:flagellar FliJ protein